MGRQVIISCLCLLVLDKTQAKALNGHIDNVNSKSYQRLYKDRSFDVYASATPYAAYSFNVPTFAVPKSNVIPVKEENVVVQNVNGYLRDSYGQRFVQAPQTLAYKSTIPQQFIQLQNLPAHLSQPLVASAPSIHYTTQPFFGQRLPNFQVFSHTPVNIVSPPHLIHANNVRNVAPSPALNSQFQTPYASQASQHETPIHSDVTKTQNDQKIREEQKVSATNNRQNQQQQQQKINQQNNLQLLQVPKENHYTNINNGQKNIYTINSKPLPLLDLTLLEPLKFSNPITPQVQHYLPRINNVKYEKLPEVDVVKKHQMEFIVQNTKSYDSDSVKPKTKKEGTKKKQKKHNTQNVKHEEGLPETATASNHDTPEENPEFSYEINSPNYKETYTEKKVSYNKETQPEPIHISYNEQSEVKPKHYIYEKRKEINPDSYNHVHNPKPSIQGTQEYYSSPKQTPKHHVQDNHENKYGHNNKLHTPSADSGQSHNVGNKGIKHIREENDNSKNHDGNRGSPKHYDRPQQGQVYYHSESDDIPLAFNTKNQKPQNSFTHNEPKHYQPITPEYEEDIKDLAAHQPHSQRHHGDNDRRYPAPQSGGQQSQDDNKSYYFPSPIVVENSKNVNDKESPESNEELMDQMVKKMRENEEDFEKAYKDAAYGFPAFDTSSYNAEKNIYNPESYGSTNYYKEYDHEKSPLIQYEEEGDDYPKFTRSQYKHNRDEANDEYFDHYVARKPESIAERNNRKEEYYQTFLNHRPEYYFANEQNDKNEKAKYTSVPNYNFNAPQRTQIYSKGNQSPNHGAYDLSAQTPSDNSPYATQAFQRYKSKTQFVEPQYQYGFEPVSIPQLLDSEMAVMASIISSKNEEPDARKKDFVDNNSWLVKKHITKAKGSS
ncbi:hypothetical protein KGM_202195 [Danaus plexippus plexippus]|uniref:Uncharacterized protein n=1 Tax=Danaus plexippus plexippus TaxID=278856 RepID=A0A212F5K5_DANPL|nr:hypothetical protein KGM_202195 [Danaus plexippus plexippus]